MSHKKISVVVLGSEDALKKALITNILGQDVFTLFRSIRLKKYPKYENYKYEVIYGPDVKPSEDLKELYANNPHTDMSLVVVKDQFSTDEVQKQIEKLQKTTGKPAKEFTVVLPLRYKRTDDYQFKCCTLDELFSKLRQLAEEKDLPRTRRQDPKYWSVPTHMKMPGGRAGKERVTEPKEFLKRPLTDTKVNLVLLGMSGTGKSASGNTILGMKHFVSKPSSVTVTTECQEADTEIDGTPVRIIDTPDMFDDEIEKSVKDRHVTKCKELCQQEPCVYLLVIHVSRFTDSERNILKKLRDAFGYRVHEQTVILFTRGADLWQGDMSFEEFLHSCQSELKQVVVACAKRCVLFENKNSDTNQVKKLMQTVDMLLKDQQKKKMTGERRV